MLLGSGPLVLAYEVSDRLTSGMFVAGTVRAEVGFALAQPRLARLARDGGLLGASQAAYRSGLTGMAGADPPGVPQVAGLVRVRLGDLIADSNSARVALRWEAAAAGGDLFAALDADLTLAPAGDRATTLTLAGVYRPPPGTQGNGPGQAVVRRVAQATIQAFLDRVAAAITAPGPASEWNGRTRRQGGSAPPAAQRPSQPSPRLI